ncbi:FMN-binding protein [Dactylosporangium matsuzakiense]|uniref:FMN-binding protein n=1 Tax=Dactylosporangium matsuzakiense TaxID=53360 RepID=A0A9W6KSQ9_9ACTN|nr:FMN-binding protein [Dactylosporangium matsuzakiense]GLL06923.1 FMN-binding protein [Dactylosporangium matsuzakiense]
MRRITVWLMSTLAAVVLLFSYRTSLGTAAPAATTAAEGTIADPTTAATGDPSPTGSSGAATSGSTTYTGSVASTRWGDVQVSITVADGKITAVSVPVYPNSNGKDQQINARALPILTRETIAAQSADIDTVSGATITSDGYIESLQAALDAAHLA